jgi:hypothetical protein
VSQIALLSKSALQSRQRIRTLTSEAMKVTFFFTASALPPLQAEQQVKTHLEFPDTALQFSDLQKHILQLSYITSQCTQAVLHVTCGLVGLSAYPIEPKPVTAPLEIADLFRHLILRFERYNGRYMEKTHLRIAVPVQSPLPFRLPDKRSKTYHQHFDRYLIRPNQVIISSPEQQTYFDRINTLAELTLSLLNTETPLNGVHRWSFASFHPAWPDKAWLEKARKAAAQKPPPKKRDVPIIAATPMPEHDEAASKADVSPLLRETQQEKRRYWARPGVFKGVRMRSQTEIRFAAAIDERGIRWEYEPEALGEEQYLVDFHLPDLKLWVECKHSLDAYDRAQLPGVVQYLARERGETLLVYTQRKGYHFVGDEIESLHRTEFWQWIDRRAKGE